MDPLVIIGLIEKGITVANMMIQAGQTAAPAINALVPLVTSAKYGAVTQKMLDDTEAILDALMAEFNEPL